MHGQEKWIVGLDLQPTSKGAVELAAWLASATPQSGATRLIGVHVLEEAYLRDVLKYHHLGELESGARATAERTIDASGARERFVGVELLQGSSADKQLHTAALYHNARGIVIGRQAPKQGRHLLRLGRVARRLLRVATRPTIVVPPDYDPSKVQGPVIATTNLRADSIDAMYFAREMAGRFGRDLVVVNVVPLPEDHAAQYLPEATLDKLRKENLAEGGAALRRWAEQHGFADHECVLAQGSVVDRVVDLAKQRGACLVCTGSRQLSTFERVLLTSIGSELAATAPCPVAVVPPLRADD